MSELLSRFFVDISSLQLDTNRQDSTSRTAGTNDRRLSCLRLPCMPLSVATPHRPRAVVQQCILEDKDLTQFGDSAVLERRRSESDMADAR